MWDQAAENLAKTTRLAFKKSLDKRAVQERYRLLTEKLKKRMAKERIESGINPTMSELDVLVEELVEREQNEAQFIRRASAVPNLINIGFDRSTAQARL